jgi:hypothetical protein
VSEQFLVGLDYKICADIIKRSTDLKIAFSDNSFEFFLSSALGIARSYHELPQDRKSISVSRTFKVISSVE